MLKAYLIGSCVAAVVWLILAIVRRKDGKTGKMIALLPLVVVVWPISILMVVYFLILLVVDLLEARQ